MSNDVPVVRDLPAAFASEPPPSTSPRRSGAVHGASGAPNGRVGTRNFVLIVPTSMCASHEARRSR